MASPMSTGGAESGLPDSASAPTGAPHEAVGPPKRNGYAVVVGRIVELLGALPPSAAPRARTASLSRADEKLLRDADERQLGPRGIELANDPSLDRWRDALRDHFRRRYDLQLMFDASETRVE